ncbi:ParB family protein [Pseudoalteromonas sp. SK20]|uniref:ParB family protein n=1 Tax=Pseudoalteromonas sp. SK20 TaxID=1938367 RepID=UPI000975B392|nr:ParB family protein [Pseudoalteromonas sp. SK20]
MARKRGARSPLATSHGGAEALRSLAEKDLTSLSTELKSKAESLNLSMANVLKEQFGIEQPGEDVVWTLKSGKKATFTTANLNYEQVLNDTFVTFEINGRDQKALNAENLSDLDSMVLQQYYPAIGRYVDGKIDVLDGSRRRSRFLLESGKLERFNMLVTKDELSISDAKDLASQLQSVKAHNLREVGLRCLLYKENYQKTYGTAPTQADIALEIGISQGHVSKAITAAKIDDRIIELFPDLSFLSMSDYDVLNKVKKVFSDDDSMNTLINELRTDVAHINKAPASEDYKTDVIALISKKLSVLKRKTEKALVTKLANFRSNGKFARKKVEAKKFSYEFGGLSNELQEELDLAISNILNKTKD